MPAFAESTSRKTFLLILAVSVWTGLLIQLSILIYNTPENGMNVAEAIGHFFRFFTILSNILVAVLISIRLRGNQSHWLLKPANQTAVALYIFIVGLVYNLVLRKLWAPEGWQWVADNLLHLSTPLLYLLYWWRYVDNKPRQWSLAIRWLFFPAVYFVYAILRGKLEGVYPYPFIDVNQLGFQKVLINALGIMLLFLATGCGFLALGRRRKW
jgi:hypothetical protein